MVFVMAKLIITLLINYINNIVLVHLNFYKVFVMSYKVQHPKNKVIFSLILLSFSSLCYAGNDGVGPYDQNKDWHVQNNNVISAIDPDPQTSCAFSRISSFPGVHKVRAFLLDAPMEPCGDSFICEAGEGSFDNASSSKAPDMKCYGPERNFDIYNKTGYTINSIYFDGNDYRTNPKSPTSSIWLVAQPTPAGGVRSTSHGGSRLAIDTDYGMFKSGGVVGTLTIQTDAFNESSAHNVTQASVVQNNFKSPDGNYILTSSVPIKKQGPNPIACAIPPANGQFSTDINSSGKTFLLPSIMEAKIKLCVNASSGTTGYYNFATTGIYQNLDTNDRKLYPNIHDSTYATNLESGYISESIIFTGSGAPQCSQYDLAIKTTASSCLDLQSNSKSGAINLASIDVRAYDNTNMSHSFTLKFSSNIIPGDNYVKPNYNLTLIDNDETSSKTYFKIIGSDDKNSISCEAGICNTEVDFTP